MPIRSYEEFICDIYGLTEQREIFPKQEPADGCLQVTVKNPKDLREKLKPVICPGCVSAIVIAQTKETPAPAEAAQEAA